MTRSTCGKVGSAFSAVVLIGVLVATPQGASADPPNCGTSAEHTVCVTPPSSALSGDATIEVSVTPNKGMVIVTWLPDSGQSIYLITRFRSSQELHGYSFVWPTEKYLDGSGILRVQSTSVAETPVDTPVTLLNGNTTDIVHTPSDWADYLPGGALGPPDPWAGSTDPVVAVLGDGGADEPKPNTLAATIAETSPALFLYLGDIYEQGTYTENLNQYGVSALDDPSGGTRWGALAPITQPAVGNHEAGHVTDWADYWHGRPDYTSFTFGGVGFLDLDSNISMKTGSPQYTFIESELEDDAPACVVAFWHRPTANNGKIFGNVKAAWALLANNGGDLVLNGHVHNMTQYEPLDASLLPAEGAHMRELISGAGGHKLAKASVDPGGRIEWSLGKTTGFLTLELDGAANGGTATGISWEFRDINGNPIGAPGSFGSVTC